MEKIDVLWLVEHVAREMDVACAVKVYAQNQGVNIHIHHIYAETLELLNNYEPHVVVHPFFYYLKGALATQDYVKRWPDAIHFNLSWEEIYYNLHKNIKAPKDKFTREKVIHQAWGNFFRKYLKKHGVKSANIWVNGNPAYQLYKNPYKQYYRTREWLADNYKLKQSSKWIFIPENYRWAFIPDSKINSYIKDGINKEELLKMRLFCTESLKKLLSWCNLADDLNVEIIFRPRPATQKKVIQDFFFKLNKKKTSKIHFIKEESVREWIMASDVVISSISTSLIESSIAGKPSYMAIPCQIPKSLSCSWYDLVPKLNTADDFLNACRNNKDRYISISLKSWAEKEMLSTGDPILKLADYISKLVKRKKKSTNRNIIKDILRGYLNNMSYSSSKKYFNPLTHECDLFTGSEVSRRVEKWGKIIFN